MENNLPKKYEKGIFCNIKNFFLNLFGKKSKDFIETDNKIKNSEPVKEKNSIDLLRDEYLKTQEKENLLSQIEENPDLINNWKIEKLMKLEEIYDKKISQYKNEIAILKGKIL